LPKKIRTMKIELVMMLIIISVSAFSQDIILHQQWNVENVKAAIKIIKEKEPELYENIITRSTIQAGEHPNADAFCTINNINGKQILWIMLSNMALTSFSKEILAATIYHEALHLEYWVVDVVGRDWTFMTTAQKQNEHERIYRKELAFLEKTHPNPKDITYLKGVIKEYGY